MSRAVCRTKDKVAKLVKALGEMKNENEHLQGQSLKEVLVPFLSTNSWLLKYVLEVAKRKSTKVMAYSDEWLLGFLSTKECLSAVCLKRGAI